MEGAQPDRPCCDTILGDASILGRTLLKTINTCHGRTGTRRYEVESLCRCYLLPATCYLLPVTCYLLPPSGRLKPKGRTLSHVKRCVLLPRPCQPPRGAQSAEVLPTRSAIINDARQNHAVRPSGVEMAKKIRLERRGRNEEGVEREHEDGGVAMMLMVRVVHGDSGPSRCVGAV